MLVIPFQIGQEHFAIPASEIHQVIPYVDPRHISGVADWFSGVVVLAGSKVPVVDVSTLLTGTPSRHDLSTRIVVVDSASFHKGFKGLGLVLEGITSAIQISGHEISSVMDFTATPWFRGSFRHDQEIYQVFDWRGLVLDELKQLMTGGGDLHA